MTPATTQTVMPSSHALAALALHDAGFCVIRATQNGAKTPLGNWKHYQMGRPAREEVWQWFQDWAGVGIVLGVVSGGAEILDFDDREIYQEFLQRGEASGLGSLITRIQQGYEEYTPNGAHLCYRVAWEHATPEGNTKLAQRSGEKGLKAIIETRGEGGFCIVAPSSGTVHESGKPYILQQGSPAAVVTITQAERTQLFQLARSFHIPPQARVADLHDTAPNVQQNGTTAQNEESPGTRFIQTTSWGEILQPAGWTLIWDHQGTQGWRRPGKDIGISATTNYQGSDLFYPFTTSTIFEAERGYNKFAVHTLLHYGGDFSAAAKALISDDIVKLHVRTETPEDTPRLVQVERTDTPEPEPESTDMPAIKRNYTDLGNAERLLDRHGHHLHYCFPWKTWLIWNGLYWRRDQNGGVMRLAVDTIRDLYQQAASAPKNGKTALVNFALKSEGKARLDAMTSLAQNFRAIDPDALDTHPWLLTTANGVLDLASQEFDTEGTPEHLLTRAIPVAYEATATCPRWEQFLQEIFADDADLIHFIQKAVGYTLTGSIQEQCFFLLHGTGANGKSKFLQVLNALLGDYAATTPFSTFLKRDQETIRNDLAALQGIRFVAAAETSEGRRFDEAMVKSVTGGEAITARFLHAEYFSFHPQFKIWLATNHKPEIKSSDDAIWRRLHLIPFDVTFASERRDNDLFTKLKAELPGILRWAVEGCLLWQQEGLEAPSAVQNASRLYREEMDSVGSFLEDQCEQSPDYQALSADLYHAYHAWAQTEGRYAENQNKFGRALTAHGFASERNIMGHRIRHGLRLREPIVVK